MFDLPEEITPDVVAQRAAEKKAVLARLCQPGPDVSFGDLCFSDLMNDTFWYRPALRLFGPRLERPEASLSPWERVDWEPVEAAQMSLVRLDRIKDPNTSLQGIIDSSFGFRKWNNHDALFTCNRPCVVRVLYTAHPNSPIPFEQLQSFEMPVDRFEDSRYIPIDTRAQYTLIAVVRMAHLMNDEPDAVRFYNIDGPYNINTATNPAFLNRGWSIASPTNHRYLLVFGPAKQPRLEPTYPEVCTRLAPSQPRSRGDLDN
ncbi:hypothetical protein QQX98_002148 [Neonectria punicea]|uniref:RES domain-containing protein n=1 Tax=Neonectria punicea TaxID=979145 RepID=A0ABR1HJU1_9HYPO